MRLFDENEKLKQPFQKIVKICAVCYTIVICMMCFLPQSVYPSIKHIETPGIQHFGQVVTILTPFNTLVHFGKIPSIQDMFVIVLQNLANIFLLLPLVFAICLLIPSVRQLKKVLLISFLISLTIESTQALLDLCFNFNRVFEVDDLITNTVGGLIAYWLYQLLRRING